MRCRPLCHREARYTAVGSPRRDRLSSTLTSLFVLHVYSPSQGHPGIKISLESCQCFGIAPWVLDVLTVYPESQQTGGMAYDRMMMATSSVTGKTRQILSTPRPTYPTGGSEERKSLENFPGTSWQFSGGQTSALSCCQRSTETSCGATDRAIRGRRLNEKQ